MSKLPLFFPFVLLMFWTQLMGQSTCASHDLLQQLKESQPDQFKLVHSLQENAYAYARNHAFNKSAPLYRIPVVVHIVYTNPQENLPDSLIFQQIEVLNRDFRRLNADTQYTRNEFKPVAEDAGIEFFLATRDPLGNPSTGITRTQGNPTGFLGLFDPFTDNVKSSALGGKDPWPTNLYLNIWVCNVLGGLGILGYAYPPVGNVPNWPSGSAPIDTNLQGIVIHFPVFGPNNPQAQTAGLQIVNKGRTLTHEMGHFLGLRHIWGDGDCQEDDGLSDTPPASDNANQICDFSKNTCPDSGNPDFPDQFENFMDYAADSCMNMFSRQQISAMHFVLDNYRLALVQNGEFLALNAPLTQESSFRIFPNPAYASIHLVWSGLAAQGGLLEVLDLKGRIVFQENIPAEKGRSMDVSLWPIGTYFVRLQNNFGSFHQKLLLFAP